MQTVIKNLPFKSAIGNRQSEIHAEMTPDEVTAWLDERDAERRRQMFEMLGALPGWLFWISLAALAVVTVLLFVL